MRILIYQPRVSYYVGGGEIVPLEQARGFALAGHKVGILTSEAPFITPSDYFRRFRRENPEISVTTLQVPAEFEWIYEEQPGSSWKRWDLESLYFAKLVMTQAKMDGWDIVAFHNVIDSLAAPLDLPSVLHLHGYPEKMNYACDLILSQRGTRVAVSHLVKKKWAEMSGQGDIIVCHNGIDTGRFRPVETEKKFNLLYIGRLIEIKGVQYLIDALALLKQRGLSPSLAVAGKGAYAQELVARVKKHGLEAQVTFLGYVPDADLVTLYNASQVAVLPSYAREGVLTTMLEAAACGIPAITTAGTSMTEFLINGVNGLTAAPKDSQSIAACIARMLENGDLRSRLGKGALDMIAQGWSWDMKINELEKIYAATVRN